MSRVWHLLTISVPSSLEDEAAGWLHVEGFLGSAATAAGEDRIELEATYRERAQARRAALVVEECLRRLRVATDIRFGQRTEESWVDRYEASRKPLHLPGGFVVLPREGGDSGQDETRTLIVPPGRAFGTGEHPTTRLVFSEMVRELRPGRAVLDVGTGSGLLALAAARLGAAPVVGIDLDPEAVAVARENRRRNGLEGKVWLAAGRAESLLPRAYDLVLANLYRGALAEAAGPIAAAQAPGGRCVISGFSPGEIGGLLPVWERVGYRAGAERREGEWAALLLAREGDR